MTYRTRVLVEVAMKAQPRPSADLCTREAVLNLAPLAIARSLATSLLLFVLLCALWGVVLVMGLASFQ